jgi:predicted ribosome quality control (RQC) complex YloA/Tae2 family protein
MSISQINLQKVVELDLKHLNILRYTQDELKANINGFKDIYSMFVQSIELEKEKTQPSIWDNYFKVAIVMVKIEKDTTILIEAYERATSYIEIGITESYKRYDKQIAGLENLQQRFDAQQIDPSEYSKSLHISYSRYS